MTYDELEPYYDKFEYAIGLSGKAGNLKGEIQAGGNPFEGPRSREFPNPPLRKSYGMSVFEEATRSLGYHPFPIPAAADEPGLHQPRWGGDGFVCVLWLLHEHRL